VGARRDFQGQRGQRHTALRSTDGLKTRVAEASGGLGLPLTSDLRWLSSTSENPRR
jgi:hypothetical protein